MHQADLCQAQSVICLQFASYHLHFSVPKGNSPCDQTKPTGHLTLTLDLPSDVPHLYFLSYSVDGRDNSKFLGIFWFG
jgi:hypothetical protein